MWKFKNISKILEFVPGRVPEEIFNKSNGSFLPHNIIMSSDAMIISNGERQIRNEVYFNDIFNGWYFIYQKPYIYN